MEYPLISIAPMSTVIRVVAPDRVISMGKIEQIMCKNKWHAKL